MEQCAATQAAQLAVEQFFISCRPFYSNLLDDLGATDTFVVDGDCLLLELISASNRVDWDHGGQFLQLRARLEQFFHALAKANTAALRFWVVWFDSSRAALPDAAAQLARALAQEWLPGALGITTLRFDSWWCQDWLSWLASTRPSLLLLTDLPGGVSKQMAAAVGSKAASLPSGTGANGSSGTSHGTPPQRTPAISTQRFLQAYIAHTVLAGPQCGFMRELRFVEGHAFGFRTQWRSGAWQGAAAVRAAARFIGLQFQRTVMAEDGGAGGSVGQGEASGSDFGLLQQLAGALGLPGNIPPGIVRSHLGAACCAQVGLHPPGAVPATLLPTLIHAWCLHELLLRHLPLSQRALRLPWEESTACNAGSCASAAQLQALQTLQAFAPKFHAAAASLIQAASSLGSLSSAAGGSSTAANVATGAIASRPAVPGPQAVAPVPCQLALDVSMADWLDGRLLHVIVWGLAGGARLALSPAEEEELHGIVGLVQTSWQAAGGTWEHFPAKGPNDSSSSTGRASNNPAEVPAPATPGAPEPANRASPASPVRLLPVVGNGLVEAVSGGTGSTSLQFHELGSQEVKQVLEAQQAGYGANYHWHTGGPIDEQSLQQLEREERVSLAGMSLEEIAVAANLPPGIRRQAQGWLDKIGHLLASGNNRNAAEQEKLAMERLLDKSKDTGRGLQMYYRHLTMYSQSLDTSKFSKPVARSSKVLASGSGVPSAHKAVLESKRGDSADQQWLALRPRLAGSLEASGWTPQFDAEFESLLAGFAAKAPAIYLAAGTWAVQQLTAAWKEAAVGAQKACSVAGPSGGPGSTDGGRMAVAVQLWAAVAGVVRKGLLNPANVGESRASGSSDSGGAGVGGEAKQEAAAACIKALQTLNLPASAASVAALSAPMQDRRAAASASRKVKDHSKSSSGKGGNSSSSVVTNGSSSTTSGGVGLSDARFQLRHCGHLLPHDTPPKRDPRVESFNPDPWQRRVLDAIDTGSSALIVAPTSSGKTFISSYCINAVVRAEGDPQGLVVFVAPTKPLVNQVAAQVYRDFNSEEVTMGVFTRDYRQNVEKCRILVTVPACLEILLLSPSAQERVRNIRYVILDEVHCMREVHLGEGGARDGAGSIWEHILLLLRCPFLALSATIGNPKEFRDWLASVKQLQAQQDQAAGRQPALAGPSHYEVQLIQHTARHSDLRLHTYTPSCLQLLKERATRPWDLRAGCQQEGLGLEAVLMAEEISEKAYQLPQGDTSLSSTAELVAGQDGIMRDSFPAISTHIASLEGAAEGLAGRGLKAGGPGCRAPATAAGSAGEGVGVVGPSGSLARMNPLGALEGSFPPELSLEPADVEELYDSMHSALQGQQQEHGSSAWCDAAVSQLEALSPETYFSSADPASSSPALTAASSQPPPAQPLPSPFLTRGQVRAYEAELKALLLEWASGGCQEGRDAVAAALAAIRNRSYQEPVEHPSNLGGGGAFVGLVLDLVQANKLPCIAFNFERNKCHSLAETLVAYLEACEASDRQRNAAKYEGKRQEAERAAKAAKAKRDKAEAARQQAGGGWDGGEDGLGEPGFDEDAVLPEFSLAGKPKRLSASDVEELIQDVLRTSSTMEDDDPLIRGLRRGVGIHHGGLPKVYRQTVEILFRAGHLRVVIATGTLAFGINMPCRTVVFLGDHIFLSALQFRQMMGRAGRRGFDPLGHVVFFGVGPRKVRSLMVSPVPHLLGHFPLTVSLCLRALALHSAVASKAATAAAPRSSSQRKALSAAAAGGGAVCDPAGALAADTLAVLFRQPFYAARNPGLLQQVQHLFRFSTEYLMRSGAIGLRGEPVGLAGMLCHLHWTDPANLAFAGLLRCGVLDDICKDVRPGMSADAFEPVAEKLLLILAHLFQTVPLHRAILQQPERFKQSPSKVVLEPLPARVQRALDRHNQQALRVFADYVRCYVEGLQLEGGGQAASGDGLPLSGLELPAGPAPDVATALSSPSAAPAGSLQRLLVDLRVRYQVCSPWAALSGRGDDFASIDDLVASVRAGVVLDVGALPSVAHVDRHGEPVPLNRYVLDYWKHQQKSALVEANGLRDGDAWQLLSAFVDVVRAISVSLAQLLPPDSTHPVASALERLAGEYRAKFAEFNKFNGPRRAGG
ncbi:hypothetical protein N2152v2_001141 [Parachlorella kessleri]